MTNVRLLSCFIALTATVTHAVLGAEATLTLLRPVEGATLVGRVEVSFLLQGVDDAQIVNATVSLDGRTVASLDGPPWRAEIDVGDSLAERRLEIAMTLADGRVVRTGRTYRIAEALERVDVRLVNLAVSVTDSRDRPVLGLAREAFAVFDQGTRVGIERFTATPEALAVALVIDGSGSMLGERIEAARSAAAAFIDELAAGDHVAVVRFADDVETLLPLSADHDAARKAAREIRSAGGTALYDAIVETSRELARAEPRSRRAIILLSDGRDEAASGLEPGSFHTLDEAIRAAHLADVEVFALGISAQLDVDRDFSERLTTRMVLERISESTGGRFEAVRSMRRLGGSFEEVLAELRSQYVLAYTPPEPRTGETWRQVEVRVRHEAAANVRTRKGYFVR